jgi:hemoglobin
MHAPDLTATKAVLVDYLVEWMGGEKRYSAARGAPMLRRRHHPFDIDAAARDAWLACMHAALARSGADAELRTHLQAAFAKIAAHLVNTD